MGLESDMLNALTRDHGARPSIMIGTCFAGGRRCGDLHRLSMRKGKA